MDRKVMLNIHTIQRPNGEIPKELELVTEGSLRVEPDHIRISYTESEVSGLSGVETSFRVYGSDKIVLVREGDKLQSKVTFVRGERGDSLYDIGAGALLLSVSTRRIESELTPAGGMFEVEYGVHIEHTSIGVNTYRVEVRQAQ